MLRIELNITPNEKEILVKALRSYISDLNMEIADTDQMDFRDNLKTERTVLKKIIMELEEQKLIPG